MKSKFFLAAAAAAASVYVGVIFKGCQVTFGTDMIFFCTNH